MTPTELHAARGALGLTQTALARALDVPRNTWARWERGALAVQHPTILRLALRALATRSCAHSFA